MIKPPNLPPHDILPWEALEQALTELAHRPDQKAMVTAALLGFQKQVANRPLIDTVRELVIFCWLTLLEEPAARPCATPRDVEGVMP